MRSSCDWETFLRLQQPSTSDAVPIAESGWFETKGVYPEAPAVIQMLQQCVLPLVRKLEKEHGLIWYCFLLHDRESGVPTTPDDHGAYIHLRLRFKRAKRDVAKFLSKGWVLTQHFSRGSEIGGVNKKILRGTVDDAWDLIGQQSAWVLAFIEQHKKNPDALAMVQQTRQYLHYFANMLQMKLIG